MRPLRFFMLLLLLTPTATINGASNIAIFGGNGEEGYHSTGAVEDSMGNVFLYGVTSSNNLPVSSDAYDQTHNGAQDLFVAKFSHDLSTLIACTYIGGTRDDMSASLVIGPDDKVYLAGVSSSSNLPVTEGAFDTSLGGGNDMFMARLSNDLTQLEALTYIGGRSRETAARGFLAKDDQGYLYLTGYTESSDFPTTEEAYDRVYNARGDSFLVKFDSGLNVVASTYVGGSDMDWAYVVACRDGLVYITGHTDSLNYPTSENCYDDEYNHETDIFVTCLSDDLSTLVASTYIGGSLFDNTSTMIIDEEGNIWLAGHTASTNYPVTTGTYSQSYAGGNRDIFISCLSSDLSQLFSSTYLGGNANDYQPYLALWSDALWVSGSTLSNNFPVTDDALQSGYSGDTDYILSELSTDLTVLEFSTYLGGNGEDWFGIIQPTSDGLLVTGNTASPDFMDLNPPVDMQDAFMLRFTIGAQWQLVSAEQPEVEEETENGIPGYTALPVLMGLAVSYLYFSTRRLKPR